MDYWRRGGSDFDGLDLPSSCGLARPVATSLGRASEREQLKVLERERWELRRTNEILKAASAISRL